MPRGVSLHADSALPRGKGAPEPGGKSLLLCRTPFQAAMLRQVVISERIGRYDLVYLTHDDAEEDVHYYRVLAAEAERAQYVRVPRQRYSVLNHVAAYRRMSAEIKSEHYRKVLISSIDDLAFRRLASRNAAAEVITFDDGSAYIATRTSRILRPPGVRSRLYDVLFRVPSARRFAERGVRHYSAYPDFDNIMPRERTRYVAPFDLGGWRATREGCVRFFVGQPFGEQYADADYVARLARHAERLELDFYVRHPRERAPLLPHVPLLAKNGQLAEDAILCACAGRRPILHGGFSTVLLNISPAHAHKTMLLRSGDPRDAHFAELGAKAGCEIVLL